MAKQTFSSKVKIVLLKGMEVIGTSASNLASNAKIKVNEINLENRRREILTDFSLQAFELWQKGVELPDPLSQMLTELSGIEERLSVLRAQKYAKVATDAARKAPPAEGEAAEADEQPVQADAPAAQPVQADEPEPQAESARIAPEDAFDTFPEASQSEQGTAPEATEE